ncbi:DUF6036 family nucleotidyltransferase [Bythopirellula polymerisocia]|nr:DUF6036 family nucleotidyltransferase [Bythopirellula polymerisocia]
MLCALNDAGVDYLVVGAFALAAHGNVRATGDIDIWVRPTPDNAQKVWNALEIFGAPRRGMSVEDFCNLDIVFQIGVAPFRIDLLTAIDGVEFPDAWQNRLETSFGEIDLAVIGRRELLVNKKASGRPKDLVDAAWLESQNG